MENNILTAKEWIYKYNEEYGYNYSNYDCNYFIMELYTSYKTKVLEEEFSKYWKETAIKILELEGKVQFLENYNETLILQQNK